MVDLHIPVWPLKGQILVTERTTPRLSMPTTFVRQTEEGSFLLGDSHEPVGFDTVSRAGIMADIAGRAIRTFPYLKDLRVVRSWAALRVMTDDGFPIYDQSRTHPGAFTVNGHSGVTLAGAHALALAPMIARGRFDEEISMFSVRRFHVQAH
jgi:glycine/D-amino acid oxidase-like deaminating enzyme